MPWPDATIETSMLERLGPYQLERRVAVGGTAEIWLAVPEAGSGRVAVKRMLPELRVHPQALPMCDAEAAFTVRCAPPQVIAVHRDGQDGAERYIAMEHIDGPDLATLVPGGPTGP